MPQLQSSYRQANKNRQKTKPEHLIVSSFVQELHLFLPAIRAPGQKIANRHTSREETVPISSESTIRLTFRVDSTSHRGWIVLCRTFSSVLFPLTDTTGQKPDKVNKQDRQTGMVSRTSFFFISASQFRELLKQFDRIQFCMNPKQETDRLPYQKLTQV